MQTTTTVSDLRNVLDTYYDELAITGTDPHSRHVDVVWADTHKGAQQVTEFQDKVNSTVPIINGWSVYHVDVCTNTLRLVRD